MPLYEQIDLCALELLEQDFTCDEITDGMAMFSGLWRARFDGPAAAAGRTIMLAEYLRRYRPWFDADGRAI